MFRIFTRRFISSSRLSLQQGVDASVNTVKSSCPAGTSLNLNIKKAGKDPIALSDDEYPTWLWTVLDAEAQARELAEDPLKQRKKQIRKANRTNIKQNNFLKQL